MLSFRINIPNRPTSGRTWSSTCSSTRDANQATGSQELGGVDHVIQLIAGEIMLFRWDGTDYTLSRDPPA